jgi:hypothetical protein
VAGTRASHRRVTVHRRRQARHALRTRAPSPGIRSHAPNGAQQLLSFEHRLRGNRVMTGPDFTVQIGSQVMLRSAGIPQVGAADTDRWNPAAPRLVPTLRRSAQRTHLPLMVQDYLLGSPSRWAVYSVPHASSCSTRWLKLLPSGVREYSTRGGTSA